MNSIMAETIKESSWEDVERYTQQLAQQVNESGFKPDYILGLSRGGWVPAVLLSHLVDWKPFASIDVKWSEDGRTRTIAENPHINRRVIPGTHFLLIEDMLETGRTAAVVRDFLTGYRAADVKLACYFARDFSEVKPDFVLTEGLTHEVLFPWEKFRE
jgi:uncharacterized protein